MVGNFREKARLLKSNKYAKAQLCSLIKIRKEIINYPDWLIPSWGVVEPATYLIRELKAMAKTYKVKAYGRMTKNALLQALGLQVSWWKA